MTIPVGENLLATSDKVKGNEKPVYYSFARAQEQIFALEPIDYFFAKELGQRFGFDAQLFHLLMALSESLRDGHTCLPLVSIARVRFGFSSDEDDLVCHHGFTFNDVDALDSMLSALDISADDHQPIVYHEGKLYFRRYFVFERQLSGYINSRTGANFVDKTPYSEKDIKTCLQQLFPKTETEAEIETESVEIDWQHVGVANAVNKGFSVSAGGPGTGKTYTVTKLLAALIALEQQQAPNTENKSEKKSEKNTEKNALNIALVAPTGKAAQRLSESIRNTVTGFRGIIADEILDAIPLQAHTLHRLLGVIPHQPNFRHHQDNLLSIDVLLIDEVSMVDLALMTRVFRALPKQCKVILLGDGDQLPSVAAGSVLTDVAPKPHPGFSAGNLKYLAAVTGYGELPKVKGKNTPADHVTYLLKSRRFDGQGGIGRLASAVIRGDSQQSWQLLIQVKDGDAQSGYNESELTLLSGELLSWLPDLVERYYLPIFSCKQISEAFSLLSRFRILCAMRKGEFGVENINELIRQHLAAKGAFSALANLYHGQPVMISENDYRLGLYNGDIGMLWRNENGHLMAVFEDAEQEFKWLMPSRLPKYETVYAMTIHKTQGSEFNHVTLVLPGQTDNKLLSRELLYTGITRAKSQLSIASKANVWRHGVEAEVKRYSGLILK